MHDRSERRIAAPRWLNWSFEIYYGLSQMYVAW